MGGPKSVACPQSLRCRQSQMEELLQPSVEAMENAWRCSGSSSASRQPVWAPRSKRPPEGSKSSANWLRSAGLFLSPPGLWTGAPRRCSGGGLRRNAARALAIMPCTVEAAGAAFPGHAGRRGFRQALPFRLSPRRRGKYLGQPLDDIAAVFRRYGVDEVPPRRREIQIGARHRHGERVCREFGGIALEEIIDIRSAAQEDAAQD